MRPGARPLTLTVSAPVRPLRVHQTIVLWLHAAACRFVQMCENSVPAVEHCSQKKKNGLITIQAQN